MLKKIIFSIMQYYWRYKFSKKATLLGRVYFGRHTRIQLSESSCKEDIVIGDNVKLYGAIISCNRGKVIIEDGAHIGPFTTIGSASLVHIKKMAMISVNVDIIDNNNHPTHPDDRRKMNSDGLNSALKSWKYSRSESIYIGENTWIGKNSTILKGVTVEENSIVASNAVVTKNVPLNSVVAGNPAKVVKNDLLNDTSLL